MKFIPPLFISTSGNSNWTVPRHQSQCTLSEKQIMARIQTNLSVRLPNNGTKKFQRSLVISFESCDGGSWSQLYRQTGCTVLLCPDRYRVINMEDTYELATGTWYDRNTSHAVSLGTDWDVMDSNKLFMKQRKLSRFEHTWMGTWLCIKLFGILSLDFSSIMGPSLKALGPLQRPW